MLNLIFNFTAVILLLNKLASEFIASAGCCSEFNVDTGNPAMLCIASNLDTHGSFTSITLLLAITDIEFATQSSEFVKLTDI